jgi:hypothetical protein
MSEEIDCNRTSETMSSAIQIDQREDNVMTGVPALANHAFSRAAGAPLI